MVITVKQLIAELEKHPPTANVVIRLNLTQAFQLSAETVGYIPGTNQVVITGGK